MPKHLRVSRSREGPSDDGAFGAWLSAVLDVHGLSRRRLAKEYARVRAEGDRDDGAVRDMRFTASGRSVPAREIGDYCAGRCVPGRTVAYRLGVALERLTSTERTDPPPHPGEVDTARPLTTRLEVMLRAGFCEDVVGICGIVATRWALAARESKGDADFSVLYGWTRCAFEPIVMWDALGPMLAVVPAFLDAVREAADEWMHSRDDFVVHPRWQAFLALLRGDDDDRALGVRLLHRAQELETESIHGIGYVPASGDGHGT